MTDENQIEENETTDELAILKKRADMMGISYHHKEGVDKLRGKIEKALSSQGIDKEESGEIIKPDPQGRFSRKQFLAMQKQNAKKDAAKLMRVTVTCMNPLKKEWEGEIVSVGSAKHGTFKKFIPYNVEWHIPKIMYDVLKDKKCSVFHTVKDHLGQKIRKSKLVPEFSIAVLPPLTKEELKQLAQRQAMAKGEDA